MDERSGAIREEIEETRRRVGDEVDALSYKTDIGARLDDYVDFFRGEHLGFAPTAQAVARWWDLAGIAEQHEAFLDRHARVLRAWERRTDTPPEDAYRDYLLALDSWRHLPYTDPGLPAALLPADWPGTRSAAVFRSLHERLRDAGAVFVGV